MPRCSIPNAFHHNPPIPFGLGAHICLGQYIAKAQLEEGLHLITQRITSVKSSGPAGWRPFPGTWGIKGLPIEFERSRLSSFKRRPQRPASAF
jgi:cytochrome P450